MPAVRLPVRLFTRFLAATALLAAIAAVTLSPAAAAEPAAPRFLGSETVTRDDCEYHVARWSDGVATSLAISCRQGQPHRGTGLETGEEGCTWRTVTGFDGSRVRLPASCPEDVPVTRPGPSFEGQARSARDAVDRFAALHTGSIRFEDHARLVEALTTATLRADIRNARAYNLPTCAQNSSVDYRIDDELIDLGGGEWIATVRIRHDPAAAGPDNDLFAWVIQTPDRFRVSRISCAAPVAMEITERFRRYAEPGTLRTLCREPSWFPSARIVDGRWRIQADVPGYGRATWWMSPDQVSLEPDATARRLEAACRIPAGVR